MSDLGISVTISRPSPTTALQLEEPGVYEIVSIGPGGRTWRRRTVEGTYQHGRRSIGEVLETMTVPLVVRVHGTSWSQVSNRAQTLIDAVSQHTYILTVLMEGVTSQWLCEPAEVRMVAGDAWDKFEAMALQQTYQLTIPRDPIPLLGGM